LSFPKYSAKLTQNYKNAILIDSAYRSYKEVDDVFKLLEEHIQQNIIKVINTSECYLNDLFNYFN